MANLQPNQFGDLLALDPAGVQRHKDMSRDAFAKAKEHRQAGDINSADEAVRFGAVYREQARIGTTRGQRRTTWRHGDIRNTRRLP